MEGKDIASAWREWLESEEGRRASDPQTIGTTEYVRQYLENRLNRAFHAGIEAAERADGQRKAKVA